MLSVLGQAAELGSVHDFRPLEACVEALLSEADDFAVEACRSATPQRCKRSGSFATFASPVAITI